MGGGLVAVAVAAVAVVAVTVGTASGVAVGLGVEVEVAGVGDGSVAGCATRVLAWQAPSNKLTSDNPTKTRNGRRFDMCAP